MRKISLGLTVLALILSLTACKELKEAQNAFQNETADADNGKNKALNNLMGALQLYERRCGRSLESIF